LWILLQQEKTKLIEVLIKALVVLAHCTYAYELLSHIVLAPSTQHIIVDGQPFKTLE
jgi:hypothetical protein